MSKKMNDKVTLAFMGSIPHYSFGYVTESDYADFLEALSFTDEFENVWFLIDALHETILDSHDEELSIKAFKEKFRKEAFKASGIFLQLVDLIEKEELNIHGFHERLFNMNGPDVIFIEDDAGMSLTVNGKDLMEKKILRTFKTKRPYPEDESYDELLYDNGQFDDEDAALLLKNEADGALSILEKISLNNTPGYTIHTEWATYLKFYENGMTACTASIDPLWSKGYRDKTYPVVIKFDDIVSYEYSLDVEDFDLKKLMFLRFCGAEDFRKSAAGLVANLISYDGRIIDCSNSNWYRDKGIFLEFEVPEFEESHGRVDGLGFMLDG